MQRRRAGGAGDRVLGARDSWRQPSRTRRRCGPWLSHPERIASAAASPSSGPTQGRVIGIKGSVFIRLRRVRQAYSRGHRTLVSCVACAPYGLDRQAACQLRIGWSAPARRMSGWVWNQATVRPAPRRTRCPARWRAARGPGAFGAEAIDISRARRFVDGPQVCLPGQLQNLAPDRPPLFPIPSQGSASG